MHDSQRQKTKRWHEPRTEDYLKGPYRRSGWIKFGDSPIGNLQDLETFFNKRVVLQTTIEVDYKGIMDYFLCNPSSLPSCPFPSAAEDFDADGAVHQKASSDSPFLVESSCSEQSSESSAAAAAQHQQIQRNDQVPFPKAGSTSPSTVCHRRKLSTGIATTPDAKHPVLEGRPVIALPELAKSLLVEKAAKEKQNMALPRSPPLKATRSASPAVPRPSRIKDRSATVSGSSSSQKRAVAPLPPPPVTSGIQKPVLHRASTAPVDEDCARHVRIHPSPLRLDAWSEPAAETFHVRGANYLNDRAKVPSEEAAFHLIAVDMVQAEKAIYTGLCGHPQERIQQAMKRERETGIKELPSFVFAVNLCVPGDKTYHQVSYFGVDNFDEIEHPATPFGRLMNRFIFGESDEFRLKTFKLIPRIVEGNFVVRKAVGSKPTILGRKIKHYFIRGPNYFEIIVDIASDPVAQRIVKLVLGYTKTLVVDMMFLLEGMEEQYLPERAFGGVRLKNIDFKEKDGKRVVERPL